MMSLGLLVGVVCAMMPRPLTERVEARPADDGYMEIPRPDRRPGFAEDQPSFGEYTRLRGIPPPLLRRKGMKWISPLGGVDRFLLYRPSSIRGNQFGTSTFSRGNLWNAGIRPPDIEDLNSVLNYYIETRDLESYTYILDGMTDLQVINFINKDRDMNLLEAAAGIGDVVNDAFTSAILERDLHHMLPNVAETLVRFSRFTLLFDLLRLDPHSKYKRNGITGDTLVHFGARVGAPPIILLQLATPPGGHNYFGETELSLVIRKPSLSTIDTLLDLMTVGYDPTILDGGGKDVLSHLFDLEWWDAIEAVIRHPRFIIYEQRRAEPAADQGVRLFKALTNLRPEVTLDFIQASLYGNDETVCSARDEYGRTFLWVAAAMSAGKIQNPKGHPYMLTDVLLQHYWLNRQNPDCVIHVGFQVSGESNLVKFDPKYFYLPELLLLLATDFERTHIERLILTPDTNGQTSLGVMMSDYKAALNVFHFIRGLEAGVADPRPLLDEATYAVETAVRFGHCSHLMAFLSLLQYPFVVESDDATKALVAKVVIEGMYTAAADEDASCLDVFLGAYPHLVGDVLVMLDLSKPRDVRTLWNVVLHASVLQQSTQIAPRGDSLHFLSHMLIESIGDPVDDFVDPYKYLIRKMPHLIESDSMDRIVSDIKQHMDSLTVPVRFLHSPIETAMQVLLLLPTPSYGLRVLKRCMYMILSPLLTFLISTAARILPVSVSAATDPFLLLPGPYAFSGLTVRTAYLAPEMPSRDVPWLPQETIIHLCLSLGTTLLLLPIFYSVLFERHVTEYAVAVACLALLATVIRIAGGAMIGSRKRQHLLRLFALWDGRIDYWLQVFAHTTVHEHEEHESEHEDTESGSEGHVSDGPDRDGPIYNEEELSRHILEWKSMVKQAGSTRVHCRGPPSSSDVSLQTREIRTDSNLSIQRRKHKYAADLTAQVNPAHEFTDRLAGFAKKVVHWRHNINSSDSSSGFDPSEDASAIPLPQHLAVSDDEDMEREDLLNPPSYGANRWIAWLKTVALTTDMDASRMRLSAFRIRQLFFHLRDYIPLYAHEPSLRPHVLHMAAIETVTDKEYLRVSAFWMGIAVSLASLDPLMRLGGGVYAAVITHSAHPYLPSYVVMWAFWGLYVSTFFRLCKPSIILNLISNVTKTMMKELHELRKIEGSLVLQRAGLRRVHSLLFSIEWATTSIAGFYILMVITQVVVCLTMPTHSWLNMVSAITHLLAFFNVLVMLKTGQEIAACKPPNSTVHLYMLGVPLDRQNTASILVTMMFGTPLVITSSLFRGTIYDV